LSVNECLACRARGAKVLAVARRIARLYSGSADDGQHKQCEKVIAFHDEIVGRSIEPDNSDQVRA
jgi:hypothetical protein